MAVNKKLFTRIRPLGVETLLDDSSFPVLFYPKFSEQIIALTFRQEQYKLYKLLEKAENTLNPLDYQFETENAIASLRDCGEVELETWLVSTMDGFSAWQMGHYY
jgi:hypothetical protein